MPFVAYICILNRKKMKTYINRMTGQQITSYQYNILTDMQKSYYWSA
jgi:hypothetical protein